MWIKLGLSAVLLTVLIFILNHAIKIKDLPQIILSFPKDQLLVLTSLAVAISVLKAWRFLILLRNSKIKISFLKNLRAFMASQAISPLPGGESMRGILIGKETGANFSETVGPVITQAYLELFSGGVLALIGSLYFNFLRFPIFLFFILLIALAYILNSHKALIFLKRTFGKLSFISQVINKLLLAQTDIKNHFIDEETHLPDKVIVRALALSLISNIIGGLLLLLIAKYYGISINIFQAVFLNSASIVIQGIGTISPGGLGFTEGGMSALLLAFRVPLGQAIAIVLLFRLLTLILNVIIGLLLLAIFYSRALLFKEKLG